MIILSILLSILILIVLPAAMGLLATWLLPDEQRTVGILFPAGYILEMVVFEIVTVPILLLTRFENFKYVVWICTPIFLVLAGLGVWLTISKRRYPVMLGAYVPDTSASPKINEKAGRGIRAEQLILWIVAAAVLVTILVLAETRVIFDGDDAYYVVQSLITQERGTMYVTEPYTGQAASMDVRHALAVFTMWISYVGTLTGIHTTIVCHTILPLVMIPLTVLIYVEIGCRLLREKLELLPYYAIFIEILILFGRVSLYTSETFLLSRTWQGKSMAANMLIPATVLSILILTMNARIRSEKNTAVIITEKKSILADLSDWSLLILIDAAAGIFSSLAVALISIMILTIGFVLTVCDRNIKRFLTSMLVCVPGGIYMILYLYYTYIGWRY